MISGANEKELDLANARADILLMCGAEQLKLVDEYYENQITNLENKNKSLKGSCKVLGKKDNNQRKELQRLNDKLHKFEEKIKQLKSILIELEEWLEKIPNYFMDKRSFNNGVYIEQGMQKQIDLTLNKIQELKERYK